MPARATSPPSQSQETVIAQVIVDIGNQHMEDDTPIEDMGVRLTLGAVFSKGIDDLRRAAALRAAHRRHRRRERGRAIAPSRSKRRDNMTALPARSINSCRGVAIPAWPASRSAISSQLSML